MVRELHIELHAAVDDGGMWAHTETVPIPPDYDDADLKALIVYEVTQAAGELTRRHFGRRPQWAALVATAARVRAIEWLLANREMPSDIRGYIEGVLSRSNEDITDEWGEDPEA